jgi:hypothetical protein
MSQLKVTPINLKCALFYYDRRPKEKADVSK